MDENNNNVQNTPVQEQQVGEKKGFAIASLVLGIVAIVGGCFWYLAIPCAIVGLILGVMANKVKKTGMATAGIVLSIIALVLTVLLVAGVFALLGFGTSQGLFDLNDLNSSF